MLYHGERASADFNSVQGIIVTHSVGVGVLDARVFPGLGEHAIVKGEGAVLEVAKLALLHVLLDGVVWLLGRHLHLGARALGDLVDEVKRALGRGMAEKKE